MPSTAVRFRAHLSTAACIVGVFASVGDPGEMGHWGFSRSLPRPIEDSPIITRFGGKCNYWSLHTTQT